MRAFANVIYSMEVVGKAFTIVKPCVCGWFTGCCLTEQIPNVQNQGMNDSTLDIYTFCKTFNLNSESCSRSVSDLCVMHNYSSICLEFICLS